MFLCVCPMGVRRTVVLEAYWIEQARWLHMGGNFDTALRCKATAARLSSAGMTWSVWYRPLVWRGGASLCLLIGKFCADSILLGNPDPPHILRLFFRRACPHMFDPQQAPALFAVLMADAFATRSFGYCISKETYHMKRDLSYFKQDH